MDKKLNEVTKVTDMAYVPVIMADGSIGQIAKADLASVVAGQISPIKYNGMNVSSDCNDMTDTGYYYISTSDINNGPSKAMYGILQVVSVGLAIYQTFYSFENTISTRISWSNKFASWKRIDNFGYNTLEELAAALKPLM